MDQVVRQTLAYQRGHLTLTDTHLFVVRDGSVAESLALRHLSEPSTEEAHSFRHRVWGLGAGIFFLVPAAALLLPAGVVDKVAVLALFQTKVGLAVVFTMFFGFLFLWGVFRSRRIWWLRIRYGSTTKLLALPGVDPEALGEFMAMLGKEQRGA